MSWDEHIMLIAHTVNVYGARLKARSRPVQHGDISLEGQMWLLTAVIRRSSS
jgi:hypothetical protein